MPNQCSTGQGGTNQGQCSEKSTSQATNNQSECCEIPAKLLCLADQAWHDLLKEKIKAQIEEHAGEKLDKLAGVVATANHKKWSNLIQQKVNCGSYQDEVKEIMLSLSK